MTSITSYSLHVTRATSSQRGLSLIELMISLTIGMVLLIGITTLIVQQSQTRDELEKSSRQIENGRYAMQILHDDIEHAGFYGKYYTPATATGTMPDPCSTTASVLDAALSVPIQGYDSTLPAASAAFTCALDGVTSANNIANYLSGTDILVIRRVDTTLTSITAAGGFQGLYFLQSTPAAHVLGTGSNTSVFTLVNDTTANKLPADLRALITRIYFISPCSVPAGGGASCTGANDDNGRPIPTLKVLNLSAAGGNPTFTVTRLVEGIENMQLDYGIDANTDGYPENYFTIPNSGVPASAPDWANVMTIRINLLARSTECSTGFTNTKAYNLGLAGNATLPGTSTCPTGSDYKRHAFTELVRVINPSARRAQE